MVSVAMAHLCEEFLHARVGSLRSLELARDCVLRRLNLLQLVDPADALAQCSEPDKRIDLGRGLSHDGLLTRYGPGAAMKAPAGAVAQQGL